MSEPTFFISAGEASGEHYGALLIAALKARLRSIGQPAAFFGMGGERMVAAGLQRVVRSEDMAVMGITEVVRHLPRIYREFRKLKRAIAAQPPSIAILIDFPDIHFRLAAQLHRLGVPVFYFVSPQLWAWKKHRIKLVQKYIDEMLVIFPFEQKFYLDHGVRAEFVGHPLADLPLPSVTRDQFARQNNLDPDRVWIGLLPGSRAKEIRDNLPEMLAAARLLAAQGDYEFVIPLAPTLHPTQRAMAAALVRQHAGALTVRLTGDARATLLHARASVVASGTATVEAALIGNPFVVVYRVSPLTYAIAQRVVSVPHVAMANLIAGRRAVPELIQSHFTAANIVQQLAPLLPDGNPRQSMRNDLERIRELLNAHPARGAQPGSAIDRVADIALQKLGLPSPVPDSVPS
jgi:lipid-A-disaccharide synthase